MDIGVLNFVTDYSMRPAELARPWRNGAFESLWVPEHTHIPASRRSPWPGGPDCPGSTGIPWTPSSPWARPPR